MTWGAGKFSEIPYRCLLELKLFIHPLTHQLLTLAGFQGQKDENDAEPSTEPSWGDRHINCVTEVGHGVYMHLISRPQRAPQSV